MANKVLAEYRTKVDQVLQDAAARVEEAGKDAAIQEAIKEYSKHKPIVKTMDIAGDGTTYDIPLGTAPGPTDWVADFSTVRQVEYPAGERKPVCLEQDEWCEYQSPTGRVLRLLETTPQTGKNVRITYAIMHTVTAAAGTISDADFDGVCNLAGSYAAHQLAMSFAQDGDSTIGADVVDHKSKSAEYAARSRTLRELYFRHMGISDEKGAPAASVTQDYDLLMGDGQDYVTHPKEWR